MSTRSSLGSKREIYPGMWEIRVSSGYRSDGKQRRISRVLRGSATDADKAIAELSYQMGKSSAFGDIVTLADWYPHFIQRCKNKSLTNSTIEGYEKQWRLRIEPRWGSSRFSDITFAAIQRWILAMSPGTARSCARTFRCMLNRAVDDGMMDASPLAGRKLDYPVKTRDILAPPPMLWSPDIVRDAMTRLRDIPIEALFLVLVGGGLRLEEGLALWWQDLAFSDMITHAHVYKAWTPRDGYKTTKNIYSTRIVSIPEPFSSRLKELAQEGERVSIYGSYLENCGREWRRLFMPPKKRCPKSAHRGKLADIPYLPLSKMRAVSDTLHQAAGTLDTLNARIHGRTSVQTSYTHYLSPSTATMDAAAEGVRKLILGGGN